VEKIVVKGFQSLEGELKGKYFPLGGMTEAERKQLVEDHFLFKKGDRFLESAGANRTQLCLAGRVMFVVLPPSTST
jgi:creatine kinase